MSKIKIVTDNTSDLREAIISRYNIEVVPLSVHFGEKTFLPGIDLNNEEFYNLLRESKQLPKTSQVSIGRFLEKYSELAPSTDKIISIHLSSKFSGTYQSAVNAADHLKEDVEIIPVDSKSVSLGLGFQILACARTLEAGGSIKDALEAIDRVKKNLSIYVYVETLEYLKKGGRIGKAQSLLGTILNIKPVLQLKDGEMYPFEKVRSFKRGFLRLYELVEEYIGDGNSEDVQLGIMHIQNEKNALRLKERILQQYNIAEIFVEELGPVVGTHIGPGVLGIILNKIR